MEQVLMKAEGYTGEVELLENRVRIKKKRLADLILGAGMKGGKEIFIKDISAIEFKKAGRFTVGYIRFVFRGGQDVIPRRRRMTDIRRSRTLDDLREDENAVLFRFNQLPAFEKIKEAIDKKIALMEEGGTKTSDLDELEKLATLRDKGIITEEEFNAKKKQLLGL